ncbi:potassium transporter TrkA [ANME-1 cluster archaeon ex4572_4]|nr:MAG: potassium transporter TrkA [ANME-1 cluster archaeon ex4572_4]PXF51500.1 MAG: potassium transporter TrkA [Methanophagales archaeon]HDN68355.1 potassium transporter TrkA [Methanomicrobia archaeon]
MGEEEGESKAAHKPRRGGKVLQVIFGCGRIGYAVVKELKERGVEVVIVDADEKKVELLKEEGFVTLLGDISDPSVVGRVKEKTDGEPEAVFILTSDSEANRKAVKNARQGLPNACLVVRAVDPADKEDFKEAGVEVVLSVPETAARTAIKSLEGVKSRRRARELTAVIEETKNKNKSEAGKGEGAGQGEGSGRLGIVVHDSPDPDAIASALALKQIARSVGVSADILYRGEIGHHVNRAFVNILGIEMQRVEREEELKDYDKLALVDASVPGANNLLPPPPNPKGSVAIVVDHHVANNTNGKGKGGVTAEFFEVRRDCGATATIMTEYLRELNIPVGKVLATALLHGIRTDTGGFKRETHPSDFFAAAFLNAKADKDLLEQIETPPMSTEMLNVVGNAILHKKIKGSYLIANVGYVANRDAIPQAADYLLNLEGITTAIVTGLCEDKICVSGRSKDIRVNLGDAFTRAFDDIGSAGGHATMAAAQLPLGIFSGIKDKETLMQLAEDAVTKRFLSVVQEEQGE